jgi:Rrf2 family transcriptional regulator, nitric oxide-sensitive transcriptional repressor
MFSQTAEYALRIMVYLATLDDQPATIAEIALVTQTPQGYLAKILRTLSLAGLVKSQRGLHGGSILARPAAKITIYDVIQSVDPIHRIESCPLGFKSHGVNLCPLHKRLDQAIASVEIAFKDSTLAELATQPSGSKPLCDLPSIKLTVKSRRA